MDEKIVEMYLPESCKTYDLKIPYNAKIYTLTNMLAKAMTELSEGEFKDNGNSVLVDRDTGNIFDINFSVYELGLENGSKLMLI